MQIIQELIDRQGYRNYLEIGVNDGVCFFLTQAARKIAVDPCFRFRVAFVARMYLRHPMNFFSRYFQTTSDEFFARQKRLLEKTGVDIAFVDGLHTHEQCYLDIINTLEYLRPNGVILVHDCLPPNAWSAATYEEFAELRRNPPVGWSGEWCGDVWKAIARLRIERPDLAVCTLDADYGIGVVMKRRCFDLRPLDLAWGAVETMSYAEFDKRRVDLLDLRPANYLQDILRGLAGSPNS